MESLLEKARAITELVERSDEARVDVSEITARLATVTNSTVVVIESSGRVQAAALRPGHQFREDLSAGREVSRALRETLARVQHVEANTRREDLANLLAAGRERAATAIPMRVGTRRLATLVLLRTDGTFDEKDMVLAEYAATILEMDARGATAETALGREAASRDQVRAALAALSLSEAEAVWHILSELRNSEGIVVASRVADRVGITRSVIVNALRKLESATVIRSRSLGMKGTYIKVLNPYLIEELRRVRTRR